MGRILASDINIRKGAAVACIEMIDGAEDSECVLDILRILIYDKDDEVRKIVSGIAGLFRGHELCLPVDFLKELIESPAYIHVTPKLLIYLEKVTDKVDDLIDLALHRFIEINGNDIANIQTRSYRIPDLVLRGLAQAKNKKRISALLDILDHLVEMNVYGINEKIERIERH